MTQSAIHLAPTLSSQPGNGSFFSALLFPSPRYHFRTPRIGKEVNTISFEIEGNKTPRDCMWRMQYIGTNRVSKTVVKNIEDVCRSFSRRKLLQTFSPILFCTPRIGKEMNTISFEIEGNKTHPRDCMWRMQYNRWNESNERDGIVKNIKDCRSFLRRKLDWDLSFPLPSPRYYSVCHELEKRWTLFLSKSRKQNSSRLYVTNAVQSLDRIEWVRRWLKISKMFVGVFREGNSYKPSPRYYSVCHELEKRWTLFLSKSRKQNSSRLYVTNAV